MNYTNVEYLKFNHKTVREHLKKLPLQKRLQAMENTRRQTGRFQDRINHSTSKQDLILGLFSFDQTKQGHDYWFNINKKHYR